MPSSTVDSDSITDMNTKETASENNDNRMAEVQTKTEDSLANNFNNQINISKDDNNFDDNTNKSQKSVESSTSVRNSLNKNNTEETVYDVPIGE